MKNKTPTEARKEFHQLLKRVNSDYELVYIEGEYDESNEVILGIEDWRSIK